MKISKLHKNDFERTSKCHEQHFQRIMNNNDYPKDTIDRKTVLSKNFVLFFRITKKFI